MTLLFFKTKNFIPNFYYEDFSKIDFLKLQEKGKTIIFLDIDNTIMSYCEKRPNADILNNINNAVKLGFEIILVSNNNKQRVGDFAEIMNFRFVYRAMKPFKVGFKKALKLVNNESKENIIFIGDQLMTDVFGANRMGIDNILVKPLKTSSEHWYTKINRCLENSVLKSIRKKDEEMFNKIMRGKENEK